MRYAKALLCVLVAVGVEIPETLPAQTGTGTVVGALFNPDATPNINAKVSALYYAGGPVETIAYSDSNGAFSFSGIPVGKPVSVVVYDSLKHVIGKGSATINSAGDTVTVGIEAVPVETQGS